jgi:succinate-semialdehyde dehydrogenase / glutarate-semialdehyde dehydrogenase
MDKKMKAIHPYTNELLFTAEEFSDTEIENTIKKTHDTYVKWSKTSFVERSELMNNAAKVLRNRKVELAKLITLEMGKLIAESESEIEKCALCCEYYAEHAEVFLAKEIIKSDASESYIEYNPLGVVLAVMPWNFPFWQVFRFAVPTLMAGNTCLLKHASNVPQCAIAIEQIFEEAGFPKNAFSSLLIGPKKVEQVIANKYVKAITLTGSEFAGSQVAALAGKYLKKTVLELGGSDPFVVLEDADIDLAVETAIKSRMLNAGQSCIAAKRFIIEKSVYDQFTKKIIEKVSAMKMGNPLDNETKIAPMANPEFALQLKFQVEKSVKQGALLLNSIEMDNAMFKPVFLGDVTPGMVAFDEELFGPVFSFIKAKNAENALELANQSDFGLGATLFTNNRIMAKEYASKIESGAVFVNGLMKSDARLPFGGIKNSGYGRELSYLGIREFVNIKTVWIK